MRPAPEAVPDADTDGADRTDLRMPLVGLAAWVGGLAGHLLGGAVLAAAGMAGAGVLLGARLRGRTSRHLATAATLLLVAAAVATAVLLRGAQTAGGPLASLAAERATVTAVATVTSDPRPTRGGFADRVFLRATVVEAAGRGRAYRMRTPVLVIASPDWEQVPLGARIRLRGRLAPSEDDAVAGLLSPTGQPEILAEPDVWWRGAAAVRQSLRDAVAHRPPDQQVLVPALVNGDDTGLDPALAEDFRATGLTHLLAVSGTNLTLVVGFLVIVARWCGIRGRGLYLVSACGIVGFILLARDEPSVLRAAAMGTVALLAMGRAGRRRGARALGVAITGLLLVHPALAVSVGFTLSVLATAGILLLAPAWRDAMAGWMPRWLAEAIAVPATAQLAVTPVVAAISGQVSIVAVAANLVVAPVVGPATVLGLIGGLLALVADSLGRPVGTLAGWCVGWVITTARHGARLPAAAVDWETGVASLALLAVLCGLLGLLGPRLLRHRLTGAACCLLMAVGALVRPPALGWPPPGWVLVACDVGQGDGLVLATGDDGAVVVDTGPDPEPMDRCLDDLGVEEIPLVVLTHLHADHVGGLTGVGRGRAVAAVETTHVLDPPQGAETVAEAAAELGVGVDFAEPGVRRLGDLTVQVLAPDPADPHPGPGDGTAANDASVVLLAESAGLRILLTGDLEPPGQTRLRRTLPELRADVIKVPHHGSRHQETEFLTDLDAEVAVVSVGKENTFGHPDPGVLDALEGTGAEIARTDTQGAVAIVADDDGPRVVTRED